MRTFYVNGISVTAQKYTFNEQTYIDLDTLVIHHNGTDIKYLTDLMLQNIKHDVLTNADLTYKCLPRASNKVHIDVLELMLKYRFETNTETI